MALPAGTVIRDQTIGNTFVRVGPLPEDFAPDEDDCLCFKVSDQRLALAQIYIHAHQLLLDVNSVLKDLKEPPLREVHLLVTRDPQRPSFGRLVPSALAQGQVGRLAIEFHTASPTPDPFLVAQSVGRLIDRSLSPRYRVKSETPPSWSTDAATEVIAAMLAAFSLGQPGPLPHTPDTYDVVGLGDLDNFLRWPDLLVSRRHVLRSLVGAPRFAARYPEYVRALRTQLADPAATTRLTAIDEIGSAALIGQPLWQAAERFGVARTRQLVVRTLLQLTQPDPSYQHLAETMVRNARSINPAMATELSQEFFHRGLGGQP